MTGMMDSLARYRDALIRIPPPGCGCHGALLSVANHGVLAGVDPERMLTEIRGAIPLGTRHIPDKEIAEAICKALQDHQGGTFTPRPRPQPAVRDGAATLQRLTQQAPLAEEADLWERSPLRLWTAPPDDAALLLATLYGPSDLVFIGERYDTGILGDTIRPAAEWIAHFRDGGQTAPHIIVNPVDGIPRPKKTGDGETLRGDGNVAAFRYCVVEFDALPREEQIRFWATVRLPIVALIDSGGKSIHGWLDVTQLATVQTATQWDTEIKERLYDRLLTPLGVDAACSNAARLSRLPGHFRTEKDAYQRLLWLAPRGRAI